jgi:tetratricopeptide (TPR) repeat protein
MRMLHLVIWCFLTAATATGEDAAHVQFLRQARAEYVSGHFSASEKLFLAALGTLQRGQERERASVLLELGSIYAAKDEMLKAERAFSESLTIYKRLSDSMGTTLGLRNLGAIYSLEGRYDDALRTLQQALKLTKDSKPSVPSIAAQVLNSLGVLYFQQRKYGKAESFFNQAMELVSSTSSPLNSGEVLSNLASVYSVRGHVDKAEDSYRRALEITEAAIGRSHPDLTFTLSSLGVLYSDSGRYTEAEIQYKRALAILEADKTAFSTRIAKILQRLAVTYLRAGRRSDAEVILEQAAGIARRHIAEDRDMVTIIEDYSASLKAVGKASEAEELRAEARRARLKESLVVNGHNPF